MIINLMKRHFQFTQGTLSLEHLYLSRLKSKDYVNTCQWFWFPLAINPARKSILGRLQKNSHYGLHIVITIEMEHKRNLQSWNVWWFRSTVIIFSYKQLFTFFFGVCPSWSEFCSFFKDLPLARKSFEVFAKELFFKEELYTRSFAVLNFKPNDFNLKNNMKLQINLNSNN